MFRLLVEEQKKLLKTPLIFMIPEAFIQSHAHINYCEVLINPWGEIAYAQPSHMMAMIRHTKEDTYTIYDKMPLTASPLHWLINYTACIAGYTNGYLLPDNVSIPALRAFKALIQAGLIQNERFN